MPYLPSALNELPALNTHIFFKSNTEENKKTIVNVVVCHIKCSKWKDNVLLF